MASRLALLVAVIALVPGWQAAAAPKVRPGVEVLLEKPPEDLVGKRLGLITNPTGVDSRLRASADLLAESDQFDLVALFGPEHGIRGEIYAGGQVGSATDPKTGLPVYSLYGATRRPLPEMLQGLEALVYDIQDVGSRGYTYISTMVNAMEECAKAGIPFVVLDRPDPLGGNRVEGKVLDPAFRSFVGTAEIPYVYGLTPGELARWYNGTHAVGCDLRVIPLKGWRRDMLWEDTGLPWVPTSPHVPDPDTCYYMVITGILGELHKVNEGVGVPMPFEAVAAPWIRRDEFARTLNAAGLEGMILRPATYIPRYHIYMNETCHGVQIHLTDRRKANLFRAWLTLMRTLLDQYPEQEFLNETTNAARVQMFHKVCGTDELRKQLLAGSSVEQIEAAFREELERWIGEASEFILYPEGNETFRSGK